MMTRNFTLIVILLAIAITGCKSNVTMADMQKQEAKAAKELTSAKEEMVTLTEMKEKYSEDVRAQQVKGLEKRKKQVNKDLKSIKDVSTESAQESAKSMTKNLKEESTKLDKKISSLKSVTPENWKSARDSINVEFNRLEKHIKDLTSNVEALNEMEIK